MHPKPTTMPGKEEYWTTSTGTDRNLPIFIKNFMNNRTIKVRNVETFFNPFNLHREASYPAPAS